MKSFDSDTHSGAHASVSEALFAANTTRPQSNAILAAVP